MTINDCIERYDDRKGATFPHYVMESLRRTLGTSAGVTDLKQPFYLPLEDKFYGFQIQRSYTDAAQNAEGEPTLTQWYEQTEQDRKKKGHKDQTPFDKFEQIHLHMVRRPFLRQGKEISSGNIHPDSLNIREGQIDELVPDDNFASNPEASLIDSDTVEDALSQLPARTRFVVEKQIDLDGHLTQDELATKFNVSRGRISAILQDGLDLLKLYFQGRHDLLNAVQKRRSIQAKSNLEN